MPLPVIDVAQMREWESATWRAGKTETAVIRAVGKALAKRVLEISKEGDSILVLAGKGHNGDDARAAIKHLRLRNVTLLNITDPSKVTVDLRKKLSAKPQLVVDGLFGIGLNRPLKAPWCEVIDLVNAANLNVVAIDIPSGLNGLDGKPNPIAIKASLTLTVGAPKRGLLESTAWPYVGRLEALENIGLVPCPFDEELTWSCPGDFDEFPPRREAASHKGTYGHLAILAGSLGYHGAAVLATRGAQRAHPGLITVFTMPDCYLPVASQLQAAMVDKWSTKTNFENGYTALVMGPGLAAKSLSPQLKTLAQKIWREFPFPAVFDASALAWLPKGRLSHKQIRVITPHPGEAARMLGTDSSHVQKDRENSLRLLSNTYGGAWVVLKGHQTLVGRAEGKIGVNSSGNPYLAQGGTGDILAGFIGGLLAQKNLNSDPFRTLTYAVWEHGRAADNLQRTHGNWIPEELTQILGNR
jgi:hydroxyethylthiazole kinase-like uncharacterized protein yjeF